MPRLRRIIRALEILAKYRPPKAIEPPVVPAAVP